MGISGVMSQGLSGYNGIYQKVNKCNNNFIGTMSSASEKVEKQQDGETIGFGTIMEPDSNRGWCMKAKYAENSKPEDPVVYVETNYGGETIAYNVNINEIDPSNASRLEIFALSSYADDQGIGCDSTFGTYSTLKSYSEMSIHNGYFGGGVESPSTLEQFTNEKLNWQNACMNVMDLLYECDDLVQYKRGLSIMDLFSKFPK